MNNKCPNTLSVLGNLELKSDDWVKAKDTFRAAKDATDGKDSYTTLLLVCIFHKLVPFWCDILIFHDTTSFNIRTSHFVFMLKPIGELELLCSITF